MGKKVIVTGGSGFIGSHVVDRLVEVGHQVTVLDHRVRPHRHDVAQAHVLAMQEQAINQTYNLEGPRKVTVLEVAQRVKALIGEHVQIEWRPGRPGDFGGKEVSGDKAKQELSWEPVTDFEQGFVSTGQWFCDKWGQPLRRPLAVDAANGTVSLRGQEHPA